MPETTTTVASLAEMLRHLADAFDAAMPEPARLSFHTYEERPPIVGLTFQPEGAACVEAWVAQYGSTYGSNRQLFNDGAEWLTTDSFELMGMTVQLSGYDPVEPETQADADVLVAEAVAALDDFQAYLTVACPACKAAVGEVCHGRDSAQWSHINRRNASALERAS